MPLAPVNDQGAHLYYEDTGTPEKDVHKTLVLIHGTYYNSGYFKPLIPYARQHNIRLVLLNQRDYRNSSPFTPAELETLHTQDKETQKGFIEKRVVELANFLEWFVRKEGIPKVSPSSDDGGLAIITWSSGNHLSIPLLGFAEVVPPSTRDFLNEYLRSIIIYDAPYVSVGSSPLTVEECLSPLNDPSLPSIQSRIERFPSWNSGYYTHSPTLIEVLKKWTNDDGSDDPFPSRDELVKGLVAKIDDEPRPTSDRTSLAALTENADVESVERSQLPISFAHPDIFKEAISKALDPPKAHVFPDVKIEAIVCGRSIGMCVYTGLEILRMVIERKARKEQGRPVRVNLAEGWNHHPHRDFPEETMKLFSEIA